MSGKCNGNKRSRLLLSLILALVTSISCMLWTENLAYGTDSAAVPPADAQWYNFRNNQENN